MNRLLAIVLLLLALGTTGCDDDGGDDGSSSARQEPSSPEAEPKPVTQTPSTAELARLQRSLADRYVVTAIAPADLPQTKPLVRSARAPERLRPVAALRVELADQGTGHVFRYETKGMARRAAISFLRRGLLHGIEGCGHTVFFSGSHRQAGQRWLADVRSKLDCEGGFSVIE